MVPTALPPVAQPAKDVAEDRALTHPFDVPEAHAGMMVTPSVRLVRPLGEGGMGAVWVADHLALRTQVVVKFISDDLKGNKEALERFSTEAAAAAQVKSPHVVQTFDHGFTEAGNPYIVMELLEGRDLGQVLDETPKLAPELVLEIAVQLSRALDRAHEKGIVHRDIKPGNIFLCDSGRGEIFVKLLDFGIAKGVDVPRIDSNTKTGSMIGSPFYMSPEQILGSRDIDFRSDLWSVGVVVFEALTGTKPFDAETVGGLAIRIHSEPLPIPTSVAVELNAAVDAWFLRACARKVDERFASAKEMVEALAAALGGEMPKTAAAPRVVTGSSDVSTRAPTLVAGATTDAGVVRPSTVPTSTRGRVFVLVALVAVLGLGSYGLSRVFASKTSKEEGHALVATDPASQPSTPKVEAMPTPSAALAPPPSAKLVAMQPEPSAAPSEEPAPPQPHAVKHGVSTHNPKAHDPASVVSARSSPPTPPTSPAVTAQPVPSGHDIF
jgi:serine/threonine protein kinase